MPADQLPGSRAAGQPGSAEIRLKEPERIGHIGPAEADADMAGLVVDLPWQEQDACPGELCAAPGEVRDARDAGKADRARRRAYPRKCFRLPLEETVEDCQ